MAQKKEATKENRDMVSILTDLDTLAAELADINMVINVYEESVDGDLEPMERGKTWGDKYFLDRWPMHKAMLSVIRHRLFDIAEGLQANVYDGFEFLRASDSV